MNWSRFVASGMFLSPHIRHLAIRRLLRHGNGLMTTFLSFKAKVNIEVKI